MSRRYGRVMITGWIEERDRLQRAVQIYGKPTGEEAPVVVGCFPTGDYRVEVEYLPEPVVFNDGDAVLCPADGGLRVRIAGEWVWADTGNPSCYGDAFYADRVVDGSMVRVGAPVTP